MDNATIELLIETVKQYPCLYDKEQASRANIDQKNLIWNEIASKLDKPVEKCKSKWRNLRDSYLKAIKYKNELNQIDRLSLYRGYKHEDSMSFLETSSLKKRRSSTDGRSRSKKRKQSEYETTEYVSDQQEFAANEDAEYLIENDRQTTEDGENSMDSTIRDEEVVTLETEKEAELIEKDPEQLYETSVNNDVATIGLPFHEVFPTDTANQAASRELDYWMSGIKETLMSLPKLMRAKAKKQVNDLISEWEIKYLESLEGDRYADNVNIFVDNK